MLRLANRALRWLGFEFRRHDPLADPVAPPPQDVTAADRSIVERVRPYTGTTAPRLLALIEAVRYVVRSRVPGDLVECGVWRGGSMMAVALALLAEGDTSRTLYLYDTFEGMSAPTEEDVDFGGTPGRQLLEATPKGTGIWCEAEQEEVRANLEATGYPMDHVVFVRGPVEQTIPGVIPDAVALLRLDTDWYASTGHELTHLFPRVSLAGVVIIDDYGHWRGARQATDEYFAAQHLSPLLLRIDYTARLLIKTTAVAARPDARQVLPG